MSAPLAVLRFPRVLAQREGRYAATTPDGAVVMTLDVTARGRQVDVTAPDASPLGRVVQVRSHRWQLLEPGTGRAAADAETRRGTAVRIGAGPPATVRGRGDAWDLVWERTTLLAARRTPRRVAKRSIDLWVTDSACRPVVVAFVVHVHRWAQAQQTSDAMVLQQLTTPPPPPPSF